MNDVRRSRRSGQGSAPPFQSPPDPPPPPPPLLPLDHTNPEVFTAWLSHLESAAQDIIAAAQDQVRPPGQRDLGRRAARTIVAESASAIESLLACARAGLPST